MAILMSGIQSLEWGEVKFDVWYTAEVEGRHIEVTITQIDCVDDAVKEINFLPFLQQAPLALYQMSSRIADTILSHGGH